jgi:ribonuclease T2
MWREKRRIRSAVIAAGLGVALAIAASAAGAQEKRQNEPGEFDLYVLALSWSPSYLLRSERGAVGRAAAS